MRKVLLLLPLLLLLFSTAKAKDRHVDSAQYAAVVKFSVFPFFEIYPALQFGVEHSFKKRFSVAHEIGFIADEFSFWRVITKDVMVKRMGVRYRFNPRFYFENVDPHNFNFYLGPELMYKYMTLRTVDEYTRYGNSYLQSLDVLQHRHDIGFGIKTGFWTGFKFTNFVMEFEVGLGGKLMVKSDNIPADASLDQRRNYGLVKNIFLLYEKGKDVRMLFNSVISMKLGWGINHRKRHAANELINGF